MTRVMLQIVTPLTGDSRGIIYYRNMFIVQATIKYIINIGNLFGCPCFKANIYWQIKMCFIISLTFFSYVLNQFFQQSWSSTLLFSLIQTIWSLTLTNTEGCSFIVQWFRYTNDVTPTSTCFPWMSTARGPEITQQGILKGEVSLYRWPPVWLVWNQLYDNWQFLFLFAKQNNAN